MLQFVDAWTNNFAYVGHGATGTGAGSFWPVGPGGDGEAPAGTTAIHCPTEIATIVGRWAVAGEADLPAVRELQPALVLTPTAGGAGLPQPDQAVPEDLRFFEQLRVWMQAFPPERDRAYQERFEPLGLFAADSPYVDADPALAAALREGLAAGKEPMESALADGGGPQRNGWKPPLRRRLRDDPVRGAERPTAPRQLAADPARPLPADPAHVRAGRRGLRRRLRAAADHARAGVSDSLRRPASSEENEMADTYAKASISTEAARRLIAAAESKAAELGKAFVTAVVDDGGALKALSRMDGAPLLSIQIAQDKAYTAAGFGLPTHGWHDFIKDDPPLASGAPSGIDRLVVFGGGYPIMVGDQLVGAIGVSGGHYSEDMAVAEAALAVLG